MQTMIEQEITQEQLNRAQDFTMPFAKSGMCVAWYKNANRDGRETEMAFIRKVGTKMVSVSLPNGRRYDGVRHIDDPMLQLNMDQRENGAWDYTQDYIDMRQWKNDIETRLEVLEGPPEKEASSGASEYFALRRKARDLGIEFTKNPPREWLEEQLKALES